jgi:hypothetical protein
MKTLELHPEFLKKNGRNQFVVLPYDEFVQLQEQLDDLADIRALDEAREKERHLPGIPLSEVGRRLNMKFRRSAKKN